MTAEQAKRNELCRWESLAKLSDPAVEKLTLETISRLLWREYRFTPVEIGNALIFLVDGGEVKKIDDDFGATAFFQITSKGTITFERHYFALPSTNCP